MRKIISLNSGYLNHMTDNEKELQNLLEYKKSCVV